LRPAASTSSSCRTEEGEFLRDIERLLKRSIERVVIEGFQPTGAPLRTEGGTTASGQRRPQQRQQAGRPRPQGQGVRTGSGEGRRGQGAGGGQSRGGGDRQRSGTGSGARRGESQPQQNGNRPFASLLGGNR
jgi:ATP-dependent RNA helicase RhlE